MPVRYQRLTYRYLQGRTQPSNTSFARVWFTGPQPFPASGARRAPVDVWETADELVVKVILAGVPEDNIKAVLYEDALLISGERSDVCDDAERRFHRAEIHYGPIQVAVPLTVPVESEGVKATYEQGVLTVRLRKQSGGARA